MRDTAAVFRLLGLLIVGLGALNRLAPHTVGRSSEKWRSKGGTASPWWPGRSVLSSARERPTTPPGMGHTLAVETMSEAIDRLRARGYVLDLFAAPGGRLACGGCGETFDATTMRIDEMVRFEGTSDPDDEAILFALHGPCGHRGLYSVAFGPLTPTDDVDVVGALRPS